MNKLIIIGNLGQDARLGQIAPNGSTPIQLSVAVTEKRKDGEHTEWFSCTRWVQPGGSTAITQYLKKGTKVAIEGKVSARSFTDRDGNTRASLEVNVQNIELLGGGQPQQQQTAAPVAQDRPTRQPEAPSYSSAPLNTTEDDLPF
jgi:single-strand DNA-binding protein